jgi:DNA-binding SARP family transcriptional activator
LGKLTRPILPGVFSRNRLFDTLDQLRERPVVWVSGPAGAGKTTLVSSYIETRKIPCLWYQIDQRDNDPAAFFYYLSQAAERTTRFKRKVLPLLTPEFFHGIPTFTLRFFETLCEGLPSTFIFVFDNYQEVPSDSPLHEIIRTGLSVIPGAMNVFLVGRSDTPPVLTPLHANRQMGFLGWDDLRLTLPETEGIIRLCIPTHASVNFARTLLSSSDGWVAGLILMLERSRKEGIEVQALEKLSRDEIFDYFASEIFRKTEAPVQDFLLQTSLFPTMTAKMAEELTEQPSADKILSSLSRNHFFTEKRFQAEFMYQYHPLFREFLLAKAKERFSADFHMNLAGRAAALLEANGQIESAVQLCMEAGKADTVASIIKKHSSVILTQGRIRSLRGWLGWLPPNLRDADPYLLLAMGDCHLPFDQTLARLNFQKAFEKFKLHNDVEMMLLSCYRIIHSIEYETADFKLLDRWIFELEKLGCSLRDVSSGELEFCHTWSLFYALAFRQPQHPQIETLAEKAHICANKSSNLNMRRHLLALLIYYRLVRGDWAKGALAMSAWDKISQPGFIPFLGRVRDPLVVCFYCWYAGEYSKAIQIVSTALEIGLTSGIRKLDPSLFFHGTMAALSFNDAKAAGRFLNCMESFMSLTKAGDSCLYNFLKAQQALLKRNYPEALSYSNQALESGNELGCIHYPGFCHLVRAYALHGLGRYAESKKHLALTYDIARQMSGKTFEFSALLAEAVFAFDRKKGKIGLLFLRKALALGRETRCFLTWVLPPSGLGALFTKALESGFEVEYVQEFIRKLNLIPEKSFLHLQNWPWPVKIFVLGGFRLLVNGVPASSSRKVQQRPLSMLKVLIALGGKGIREEQISDILWPDADGDAAHDSFITTLHRLRRILQIESALEFKEGKLTLDERYCWVDLWALENIMREIEGELKKGAFEKAAQWFEKALQIYRGPFLPGEQGLFWTITMRERMQSKFLKTIFFFGNHWEKSAKWEKAIEFYERGLEMDDLAEELYCHLMICYRQSGQPSKALSVYQRCKKSLQAVLGVEPSSKTEEIYRAIGFNVKRKTGA